MLNDGASTSSSSSNDEEDGVVGNNSLMVNMDTVAQGEGWNTKREDTTRRDGTKTTTVDSVVGKPKKRIKLSIGATTKALVSSPNKEHREQQKQHTRVNTSTTPAKSPNALTSKKESFDTTTIKSKSKPQQTSTNKKKGISKQNRRKTP